MVMCCAVVTCKNRAKKGSGITFHSFPSDKELLAKWLCAIGRDNYKPNDFSKICSMHFRDGEIYTDKYNRRFVKKGVVPSRFSLVRTVRRSSRQCIPRVPEVGHEVVITSEEVADSTLEDTAILNNENSITVVLEGHSSTDNFEENQKTPGIQAITSDDCSNRICNNFPEFLKPKVNNSTITRTDENINESGNCFQETLVEDSKLNSHSTDTISPACVHNKVKKRKSSARRRDIGVEDFDKIDETRLADPKVVKQLLTIAYKTIQEQRKVIATWRQKYKNMEQKVVGLHKTLKILNDERCSCEKLGWQILKK